MVPSPQPMPDDRFPARSATAIAGSTPRLMSLDALRGFDMFWIIGAEDLVHALHKISDTGIARGLADQLTHEDWEGFRFYDLIFPLFVFIVGVSLVFSLSRTIETAGRASAVKRVIRRGVLLFIIGIFYSGGVSTSGAGIRLLGEIGRASWRGRV